MSYKFLSIFIVSTLSMVMLSCGDDEPTIIAPEAEAVFPTEGVIGSALTIMITGTGLNETTVTSDDDDLLLADFVATDTKITVSATISDDAFAKTVNLILTNTEGVDSVSFTLIPASLAGLTWSTMRDIPTPRWGLSVVTVDSMIYAIGGVDASGNAVATVEIFDPSTNIWRAGIDLPLNVVYAASAVIDGKIYIAGGLNLSIYSSFNMFDPSTNTWTNLSDMPTARFGAGGVGYDGKFYVSGGNDATSVLNKLESYDVATSSWTTLAEMPSEKRYFGAVAYDDRFHVIGGDDGTSRLGTNLSFNSSANSWSATTDMPTPRRFLMVDKYLGNIIAAGGEISVNLAAVSTTIVETLDPASDTWLNATELSAARDSGGIAVIGKKIYLIGGGSYNGKSYSTTATTLVGEIP